MTAITPLTEEEEALRFGAYEITEHDGESAELLGMPRSTYAHWRRSRNLPAKIGQGENFKGARLPESEERRRQEAYAKGWCDSRADYELGLRPGAFGMWRALRGLEANPVPVCVICDRKVGLVYYESEEGEVGCASCLE